MNAGQIAWIILLVVSLLYFGVLIGVIITYKLKIKKVESKYKKQIIPAKSNDILRKILVLTNEKESLTETGKKIINILLKYHNVDYCTIYVNNSRKLNTVATNLENHHVKDMEHYASSLIEEVKHEIASNKHIAKIKYSETALDYDTARERGVKYMYFMPIATEDDIIGAILLENRIYINEKDQEWEFFDIILDNMAVVLQNLIYYDKIVSIAMIDGLTQVYNRRYMEKFIDEQIKIHEKNRLPFSIAVFDIDFFKKFNDTYGHQYGDLVLKEVSKFIKEEIRENDKIFRYGGEEFVIFFNQISNKEIFKTLDNLRHKLSELELQDENGVKASVTASFGLSEYIKHGNTLDKLIKCADEALYYSKHNGRNKVTDYESIKNIEEK